MIIKDIVIDPFTKEKLEVDFEWDGEIYEKIDIHDAYGGAIGYDKYERKWTASAYICDGNFYDIDDYPELETNKRIKLI